MEAPRLLPPRPAPSLPAPDGDAQAALDRSLAGEDLVVLGAPGTGRTTVALHMLVEHVRAGQDAVLLAPTRGRADTLRRRAALLLAAVHGAGTQDEGVVRVRTPASLALTILTTSFAARPQPLPAPVLLRGAEEDAALARLVTTVAWPGLPREAVASRAFREELRNLLARAGELGVGADELVRWGRRLGIDLWTQAAQLLEKWDRQGKPDAARRDQVRQIDTPRLQDRACEALSTWDADGVSVPRPVPDVVIVDDYQDCTAATARLLSCLATPDRDGRRAQVVVLGDPDVAVETFRGGIPSLLAEAEASAGLSARRMRLGTRHRGTPLLAAVVEDQASRVPVTGTATHRRPVLSADLVARSTARAGLAAPTAPDGTAPGPADGPRPAPDGVDALVASSPAQESAQVAHLLRAEHIHHATPWDEMAVIVRSSSLAEATSRDLRRRGVPLRARTPAVLLRAEPASAALLAVARAALDHRLGDAAAGVLPERPSAIDLLTSPLIGLTTMDLRRLRRRLRRLHPDQAPTTADDPLMAVLGSQEAAHALTLRLQTEPLAEQAGLVARAAAVISAVRNVVARAEAQAREHGPRDDGDATAGDEATVGAAGEDASGATVQGRTGPRVDIETLLWAAWDAAGKADDWRDTALTPRGGAGSPDAVLAESAEHDLDVVTALFKRAETWAENHPGARAEAFLDELAAEAIPSDSVASQGVRPPGVAVLTPTSAAGGQWQVVVVMGLTRDTWPDLRLRDSLTRAGLLVDAITDRLPIGPGGAPTGALDPAAARAQVRADERRLLVAALSRATRRLVVISTSDAEDSPSPFFYEVAQAAGLRVTDEDGAPLLSPDVTDLTLRGRVGLLRRTALEGYLHEADDDADQPRERARQAVDLLARLAQAQIPGADPAHWAGLSGASCHQPLVRPGDRVRVSPSDVEALARCPLRWFLVRQGGSRPATGAQTLGTVIHAVAERAQRENLRGGALMAAFEEHLGELAYPQTWFGQVATDRARDMIERLDHYLRAVPGEVSVEKPIEAEVDLPEPETGAIVPVRIVGRIDRLEHVDDADTVRVIDLKTGQHVPPDAARHPQLATYRLALETLGYDVVGGALVLLGKESKRDGVAVVPAGAALTPSPDPETGESWAEDMVARAALAATGPGLQARTGEYCRTCPVRSSCSVQAEGKRVTA